MKRIALLVACLLTFSACAALAEEPSCESYVFYDVSKHDVIRYQYFVFDRNGDVLYDGYESANPPKAQWVGSDVLELQYLHGNADYRRYFNVATGQISPVYAEVAAASSEYVLYTSYEEDAWYMVVAGLFDGGVQQRVPIDLGTATGRVESAIWNEDATECTIEYISGEYGVETVTLSVPR